MKWAWLAVAWIVSLALAYALGSSGRRTQTPVVPPPVGLETSAPAEGVRRESLPAHRPPPRLAGSAADADRPGAATPIPPPVLAVGFADPADVELVARIDALLRAGRKGHLDLLRLFDHAASHGPDWLWPEGGGEDSLRHQLWMEHLRSQEELVFGFLEDVFRVLAHRPKDVADLGQGIRLDPLGPILHTLPIRMQPDRFARLRDEVTSLWSKRDGMPEPARTYVEEGLGEVLIGWTFFTPVEAALERLARSDIHPDERAALLDALPEAHRASVDLPAQIDHFIAGDHWHAVFAAVGRLDPRAVRWDDLQASLVDALARGGASFLTAERFLTLAGRTRWSDARPLVEACLFRGRRSGEQAMFLFSELEGGPSTEEVRAWLRQSGLDPSVAKRLRSRYGSP